MGAKRGATWFFLVENAVLAGSRLTGATTDAAVTYRLTLNGRSAGSGGMAWETYGYDGCWVAKIAMPATTGVLVAVATLAATVDDEPMTDDLQASVEVT